MSIELRGPALGESITQATVGTWLKKEGDAVQVDEPVVEVESEKATVALPAPAAGVLRKILKASGTDVAVGEVIAELEEGAAAKAAAPPGGVEAGPTEKPTAAPPAPAPVPAAASPRPPAQVARDGHRTLRAPPSVRRLMAENGIDPAALAGAAVVRRADVERAIQARGAPAPAPAEAPSAPRERAVPM